MNYDVFISYSRRDYIDENKQVIPGNIISQIKDLFDKNGISYWFDEDGVYSGDAFAPVIARNIKSAKIFLFVSSAHSNASEWTSNEIATAHAYKKKIIPFRYDESVYNDSVIIYIARLDYIDYKTNPSKSLSRLLLSVQNYLKEERKREEQESKNRRDKQEQEQIVADIRFNIKTLNNAEEKLQLDKETLLRRTESITDVAERDTLKALITNEEKEPRIKVITQKVKTSKWIHIVYNCTLMLVATVGVCALASLDSQMNYYQSESERAFEKLYEYQETISAISTQYPFIIEDIDIRTKGGEYDETILSINTTYLYPRIKYIGLKKGNYELGVKLYRGDGTLSQNPKISPKEYSYLDEQLLEVGGHYCYPSGWGSETKGHWDVGQYRIEVWYNNKKMAEKTFNIY